MAAGLAACRRIFAGLPLKNIGLRICCKALLVATGCSAYNNSNTVARRSCSMLSENIKAVRKAKGLSQQELAVQLNVVRQTVSKWEQGVSHS